jgi:aspartate aminotransferase-like enzyme
LRRETIAGREARYTKLRRYLRLKLVEAGLQPYDLPESFRSSFIQLFHGPSSATFERWRQHLAESGYVIYSDQETLASGLFGVSVVGALTRRQVDGLAKAFEPLVSSLSPLPGSRGR